MNAVGLVVFALTYVLISVRRLSLIGLDRPAAALLGAVACVTLGVLSPSAALQAIDRATLLLLFGVMGMGAFLAVDGFFDHLEQRLLAFARTPQRLLGCVVWGAGSFSALITNDAVCLLGAPLVVRVIERHKLPPLPFLLALATGANTGSVATLVGNPQNMLCAELGGLSYAPYLLMMAPVAVVSLLLNHLLLWFCYRKTLPQCELAARQDGGHIPARAQLTLGVIVATAIAYTLGTHLAWSAVAGFVVLMLVHRRDTRQLWPLIDWALLLFFAALFVVVAGLEASGAPAEWFRRFPLQVEASRWLDWVRLAGVYLVGSNVVSNVPFILIVSEPTSALVNPLLGWQLLAMASTFAGNLTLLGSVANIIVAEAARELGGIGFWEHFRVGLPLALSTTGIGLLWLLVVHSP